MAGAGAMFFDLIEVLEAFADGFFGFFPDGTGVDQDQVSDVDISGGLVTCFCQDGSDDLTVIEVHLAAITLDIEMPLHGLTGFVLLIEDRPLQVFIQGYSRFRSNRF